MSEKNLKELTEILTLKKELLASMLESLRRSIELLEEDNIDGFNCEMDRCSDLMRRVDEISETEMSLCTPNDQKPVFIAEAESEIKYIIGQIAEANMECNSTAKEKLINFGHRLKSLRQKRQGITCYAYQGSAAAAFVDMKL